MSYRLMCARYQGEGERKVNILKFVIFFNVGHWKSR